MLLEAFEEVRGTSGRTKSRLTHENATVGLRRALGEALGCDAVALSRGQVVRDLRVLETTPLPPALNEFEIEEEVRLAILETQRWMRHVTSA
jgi:hypothetical protein